VAHIAQRCLGVEENRLGHHGSPAPKGFISDPTHRAKSVIFTEEGLAVAETRGEKVIYLRVGFGHFSRRFPFRGCPALVAFVRQGGGFDLLSVAHREQARIWSKSKFPPFHATGTRTGAAVLAYGGKAGRAPATTRPFRPRRATESSSPSSAACSLRSTGVPR